MDESVFSGAEYVVRDLCVEVRYLRVGVACAIAGALNLIQVHIRNALRMVSEGRKRCMKIHHPQLRLLLSRVRGLNYFIDIASSSPYFCILAHPFHLGALSQSNTTTDTSSCPLSATRLPRVHPRHQLHSPLCFLRFMRILKCARIQPIISVQSMGLGFVRLEGDSVVKQNSPLSNICLQYEFTESRSPATLTLGSYRGKSLPCINKPADWKLSRDDSDWLASVLAPKR